MRKTTLLPLLCAAMIAGGSAQAATLSTDYNGTIENDGFMFDLSVLGTAITLQSFDVNADGGTFNYEVYYRAGGIGDAQTDPSAWTLLTALYDVATSGAGQATTLDVDDLLLAANSTYGFYITDSQYAFSVNYGGTEAASGTELVSDGNISIAVGYGVAHPFTDPVGNRAFNGGVTYALAPAPALRRRTGGLAIG